MASRDQESKMSILNAPQRTSGPSSPWSRVPLSNLKLTVEIFDGTGHFDEVEDKDWSIINRLACETIRSCLSKEQKYAFKSETFAYKLWKALEDKFLKKTGQNKLLMKKRLFRFDYRPGHWKKDCPKLKKKGVASKNANAAEYISDAESDTSLVVSPSTSHQDKWILDSGCTYHMSPIREWFFEFQELDGGVVYMGNDNPCKTAGIGSIKLRNHDGSIGILQNVRYVPKLKKNLISLGALEATSSTCNVERKFWAEAVTYAQHLVNRLPSSAIGGKTPLELDPRAKKALFMGFNAGVKGYRLWCLEAKRTIISRDVTFDESAMLNKMRKRFRPKNLNNNRSPLPLEERREIHKPARFTDMVAYALPVVDDVPCTYPEAIRSLESGRWASVMEEEIESHEKNKTWELTQLPKGKRAIGCKWVFAKKEGFPKNGDIRYKARLVAKGYAQKEGIDYNEIFSLVVKHSSIRILLALVVQLNFELAQLDVKTAFLHGDLREEIYMTQPDGYKVAGKENWVCKLIKSLYGLKQSPRQWYKRFDRFIKDQKYTRNKYDNCVYLRKLQDGSYIYLLLYVDDMLIAAKSQVEIDILKAQLNKEFEMKDLGKAKKILGMEISRNRERGKLWLSQKQYLQKVLQRFGIHDNTKPVSTPLAPHLKLVASYLQQTDEEREYMATVPYANAVGSLMYAMVCTRPDISQAVSVVSRFMHDPGKGHWQAVKWILRCLQNTVDVGLAFERDESLGHCIVGSCDYDYAVIWIATVNKRLFVHISKSARLVGNPLCDQCGFVYNKG
ncbi:hypothetical protein H6P81_006211 [Aristolochia fimbriata]|uniref:Uncharacterized protein n=1 Tax=Aristolochia fimbriata TaxID=158543 RepID=A0AAV7EWU0_ARIFI|nr:hypothetical protein H6P81_006211 [Aristolochia fimbriata]